MRYSAFWRKGAPRSKGKMRGLGPTSGTAIPVRKNGWKNQLSPLDAVAKSPANENFSTICFRLSSEPSIEAPRNAAWLT